MSPSTAVEPFTVGERVWFAEERLPYTVQAVGKDGRFVACTKPFAARRTMLYAMLDTVFRLRGVDNSIGNSLGYETRADCEKAVALFDAGEYGFSGRNKPIPLVISKRVRAEDPPR